MCCNTFLEPADGKTVSYSHNLRAVGDAGNKTVAQGFWCEMAPKRGPNVNVLCASERTLFLLGSQKWVRLTGQAQENILPEPV